MYPYPIRALCCIRQKNIVAAVLILVFINLFGSLPAQNTNALWQADKAYIYKSRISMYGREFSGIMVIKRNTQGVFRTVFMNEAGMKYFDFELGEDTFRVVHIFKPLDRKIIIRLFTDIYSLMLFVPTMPKDSENSSDSNLIKSKKGNKVILYYANSGLVSEIYRRGLFRKKRQVLFNDYKEDTATDIVALTKGIRFKQTFILLKK